MKEDEIIPLAVVDALGLFCPLPVIKTEKKLRKLRAGDVVKVLSDDPTFPKDISDWCRKSGNILIELRETKSTYQAYVKKKS